MNKMVIPRRGGESGQTGWRRDLPGGWWNRFVEGLLRGCSPRGESGCLLRRTCESSPPYIVTKRVATREDQLLRFQERQEMAQENSESNPDRRRAESARPTASGKGWWASQTRPTRQRLSFPHPDKMTCYEGRPVVIRGGFCRPRYKGPT